MFQFPMLLDYAKLKIFAILMSFLIRLLPALEDSNPKHKCENFALLHIKMLTLHSEMENSEEK